MEVVQTKPISEGRLHKALWIVSSWWKSWKAGFSSRLVRKGYGIGLVSVIAVNVFVSDRALAFAASVGPLSLILVIALITQPLIVGRRILADNEENHPKGK